MLDLWLKFHFGAEHDLRWFEQHGFIIYRRKTVQEAFPRPFLPSRIPVYLGRLLGLKAGVEAMVGEDWGLPGTPATTSRFRTGSPVSRIGRRTAS